MPPELTTYDLSPRKISPGNSAGASPPACVTTMMSCQTVPPGGRLRSRSSKLLNSMMSSGS